MSVLTVSSLDAESSSLLTTRDIAEPFAIIASPLSALGGFSGEVCVGTFLRQVQALSAALPDHQYVVNLCDNRYLFTVLFCAAILRGQTNLLPPNKKEQTQALLKERYGDVYVGHDWLVDKGVAEALPCFDLRTVTLPIEGQGDGIIDGIVSPSIPSNHLAAISFTSGSTGDSAPNHKTWKTIVESSTINARHMLASCDGMLYQLATVPPQHMWGLETSVLLPLFNALCVMDARPLFPQDISDALSCLPAPRMLVSAPVHLRALCASGLGFPHVSLTLCATSPLSAELALEVEQLFSGRDGDKEQGATLREVYGCSEVGSMAIRRAALNEDWLLFTGIQLEQNSDGGSIAKTAYLPAPVVLQDRIRLSPSGRFRLDGRDSDMVDIAGKRGSLLELNKVLLNYPGIIDGVIFLPETKKAGAFSRLAALVVLSAPASTQDLKTYLAQYFDNAFIPRPIINVPSLPREENGKLPRQRLLAFYQARLFDVPKGSKQ